MGIPTKAAGEVWRNGDDEDDEEEEYRDSSLHGVWVLLILVSEVMFPVFPEAGNHGASYCPTLFL